MKEILELEQRKFTFSVVDERLKFKYMGDGLPDDAAAMLLKEIKNHKSEAIAFLMNRQKKEQDETRQIILRAYKGELKRPCLIATMPEYISYFGSAVWLCPDEASRQRVKARVPDKLTFDTKSFFNVVQLISEQGEQARPVLECYKMFGGSLSLAKDAIQTEPEDVGRDLSPYDSYLWIELLKMARKINIDFAARLLYLRGAGCRLVENERTGYKIVPIIDGEGRAGWSSLETYNQEKWCLNPYRQKLVGLFEKLKEMKK